MKQAEVELPDLTEDQKKFLSDCVDKLKSSFKPDTLQTSSINQLKFAFNMIKNNKNVDDKFKTI